MKQIMRNPYIFLLLLTAFVLQGCVTTPETPRETVAVAEISYQEALETATRWTKEGRIDAEEKARLSEAFDSYERSRNAARAVIRAHEMVQAGATVADLQLAELAQLVGITRQELEAAQAAGQLVQMLAGRASNNANAVSLALVNLRNVLAEVE